jgi:hypothetical protein
MNKESQYRPFKGIIPESKYVAFIDILGFSKSVEGNFDKMITSYQKILERLKDTTYYVPEVSVKIFSDSLLLISSKLGNMVTMVNLLHFATLSENWMIRGGIGFGNHIELDDSGDYYVLSHGLIEAVSIEKSIRNPCVAVSPRINVPPHWWTPLESNFLRGLLYYKDIIIVNPFGIMWGYSAMTRASLLLDQYPEHEEKYNWFINLYKAVNSDKPLIPDWVMDLDYH